MLFLELLRRFTGCCIVTLLLVADVLSMQINIAEMRKFSLFGDSDIFVYIPGTPVDDYVKVCIEKYPDLRGTCIESGESLSYLNYGIGYTPSSNSNPTIEDMFATRTDVLEYLQKVNDYKSYLEIGCDEDQTFGKLSEKFPLGTVCVDPNQGGTMRMTSDEFFDQNTKNFDLIFIDGLHEAQQVLKDVMNALSYLNAGGMIVLHDLNPSLEKKQSIDMEAREGDWNGDCWKVVMVLRQFEDLDLVVIDVDHGVGVLSVSSNTNPLDPNSLLYHQLLRADDPVEAFTFQDLDSNRNEMLRLVSMVGFRKWLASKRLF
mmetsp:Transcript_24711/g.41781  ORF Transcript_24711/g.41781 Transcript_24711/m.41781 type:complete len:316 (-) Transcript_24711:62-1009(-)